MAADGGILAFGDATFHGSGAGSGMDAAVVSMATTRSGGGYWISTASGRVLNFGDADPMGSLGARPALPVVSMTALG